MNKIGIIGGSGFYKLAGMGANRQTKITTIYGNSVSVVEGNFGDTEVVFLARHGDRHNLPPHQINFRANIDAMSQLGVTHIIAVNAVGSMHSCMPPGAVVLPTQVVDYTWGRKHTFFDEFTENMVHIDFTEPLKSDFRLPLFNNLSRYLPTVNEGVYACTQGPRLETAAEIKKYKNDGCDLVGMTLMPEAALSREKQIHYISVCVVCNWAAGAQNLLSNHSEKVDVAESNLDIDDIKAVLAESLTKVQKALADTLTFS